MEVESDTGSEETGFTASFEDPPLPPFAFSATLSARSCCRFYCVLSCLETRFQAPGRGPSTYTAWGLVESGRVAISHATVTGARPAPTRADAGSAPWFSSGTGNPFAALPWEHEHPSYRLNHEPHGAVYLGGETRETRYTLPCFQERNKVMRIGWKRGDYQKTKGIEAP